jgi:hypothetical protein
MLKKSLSKNNITKALAQISLVFGLFALFLLLPKPAQAAWMEAGGVQCHDCIYQVDGHTVDTNHVEVWLYAVDDAIPGATIYDKRITNAFVSIGGVNANECGQSVQGLGYNQSNNGRVGLRESCYHKMTLTASAPGYDSISYDVNVYPNDCNLLNHNGDVVDYYAHLIRNTPPPAGGINVTYTCLSDNTHVKADISWNADSSQRKLWVDKGNDGTPVPPEITENSNPGTSITSSTNSYSFGSSFGLLENTSNNFAVLTGGNQLVAQNRNNRALNCGTTTPGDDQPGGNPPGSGTGRLHIRVFNDTKDIGLFHNNDGTYDPFVLESEAPNTKVRLNSRNGSFMPRDDPTNLQYEEELSPGDYRVYFLPDPGWEITKYSIRRGDYANNWYEVDDYNVYSPPDGYYYTLTAHVNSNEHSYINLGVTPGAQPDFQVNSPSINNGTTTFEQTTDPVPMSGIAVNSREFLVDSYDVKTGFYIDKNIPNPNPADLSGYIRAATTTGTVSTGMIQAFVSSTVAGNTLAVGSHTLQICADYLNEIAESNETNNCTSLPFTVGAAPNQWLQTIGGDIAVRGLINAKYHEAPAPPRNTDNATYLVAAVGTISTSPAFNSTRGWLVPHYTAPINNYPSEASSYSSLLAAYSRNGIVTALAGLSGQAFLDYLEGLPAASRIVQTGDLTVNGMYKRTDGARPKIIFVNGNLNINGPAGTPDYLAFGPLETEPTIGLIFIVSGNTRIATRMTVVESVIITYGQFSTSDYSGCSTNPTVGTTRLDMRGAVYAFGQACFSRNIGGTPPRIPAEIITYEPKYLVIFKDIVGQTVASFKETAP